MYVVVVYIFNSSPSSKANARSDFRLSRAFITALMHAAVNNLARINGSADVAAGRYVARVRTCVAHVSKSVRNGGWRHGCFRSTAQAIRARAHRPFRALLCPLRLMHSGTISEDAHDGAAMFLRVHPRFRITVFHPTPALSL